MVLGMCWGSLHLQRVVASAQQRELLLCFLVEGTSSGDRECLSLRKPPLVEIY